MGINPNPVKIQFWNLPTGSKIAYFFFKGKEPRKHNPIIYLHGGPGGFVTPADTAVFCKLADDGYDVYLYDQIGGGKSARLVNIKEYSVERHLFDLEAIVNTIGASKVIFIGHSWGASLAPLFLAIHPDKVEKLIFSGPGGILPKKKPRNILAPDSLKLKRDDHKKYNSSDYLDSKSFKRFNKIFVNARTGKRIASDQEFDSLFGRLMTNQALKKSCNAISLKAASFEGVCGGYSNARTGKYVGRGKDQRKFLEKCDIPVLILLGECDYLQWEYVEDYLHVFKKSRLIVIPNSGHTVFSFQPDLCLKLTREFLLGTEK